MTAKRISFVVSGLRRGGAETMLLKLINGLDRSRFEPRLISLSSIGGFEDEVRASGMQLDCVGMRRGIPSMRALRRLRELLSDADLVQTWMYHADMMGCLAVDRQRGVPIVWGVRHTDLSWSANKVRTILTARACAWLSKKRPARIVCCAEASRKAHEAFGYEPSRMVVIPNGFEMPGPTDARSVRRELRELMGVNEEALIIGNVARFHPLKGHAQLLQAIEIFSRDHPHVHFGLMGDGVDEANPVFRGFLQRSGLGDRVHLMGEQPRAKELCAGFDLSTSASLSEGFPGAVGEAMACGIPSVATDVGDTALLIGATSTAVAAGDPEALAAAWACFLALSAEKRKAMGDAARSRIQTGFTLEVMCRRYQDLYETLLIKEAATS